MSHERREIHADCPAGEEMIICVLKIEWPVLGLVLHDGPFYEENWQPDRKYWNGRTVYRVSAPLATK